jgi:hypothetical protein
MVRDVLRVTAAVLAAVIVFLLMTLPLRPRAATWTGDPGLARRTVAGAYHIHTTQSDGSGDRAAVAAAAAAAGLQFIMLTDHGDGTRQPAAPEYLSGVLCLDGVEISTNGGHYAALGMRAAPYPLGGEPSAVVEDVARLGGFGFAAHPDSPRPELAWTDWTVPVDGLEWLNADSEWRNERRVRLARVSFDYLFRPGSALASMLDRPVTTLARWDALTARRPMVAIAGHDAHGGIGRVNDEGRRASMGHVPSYEASFRSFSTRAVLKGAFSGEAAADARLLLDAVRTGETFTAIDASAGPAVLDFHATRGGELVPMGSVLTPGPAAFVARAAVPPGSRIVVRRNGVNVADASGGVVQLGESPAVGAYRVEVEVPGAPGSPPVPWLLSNPIYFLPTLAPPTLPPSPRFIPLAAGTAWHVEKDPASTAAVSASGAEVILDYRLAPGDRASQFAAVVADLHATPGASRSIRLTASAPRPMRLFVQLRYPQGGGQRWARSIYVDSSPREIVVPIEAMAPMDRQAGEAPDASAATSLLFVVDLTNARPGAADRVRIADVAFGR